MMGNDFSLDDIEKQKKEREKREEKRRNREIDDLRRVLAIVEGRRVIWRLLSEAGIYRSTFDANALSMAFKEGKRDIGLFLIEDINAHAAASFAQMQREAANDAKIQKLIQEKKAEKDNDFTS